MTKERICVNWFEDGDPIERGFRVDLDDPAWHQRVRKCELAAIPKCDEGEDVTVFSTSLDGETTMGDWDWNEEKQAYEYHELG
jgi:hypothetical protein